MKVPVVGLVFSKNVVFVCGVDEQGKLLLNTQIEYSCLMEFFAEHKQCLIGMIDSENAHYWAATFILLGHAVKFIASTHINHNESNAVSAENICHVVMSSCRSFVPVRLPEQQAMSALCQLHQQFVKQHSIYTKKIQQVLRDVGIFMPPQSVPKLLEELSDIITDDELSVVLIDKQAIRIPVGTHRKLYLLQSYMEHLHKMSTELELKIELSNRVSYISYR